MDKSMHGPPTACKHTVSGSISLPSQGCFSPFPHGTGSLSVAREYLALESGLPSFLPDYTCPVVLRIPLRVRSTVDYGVLTLYDSAFQQIRLVVELITLLMRSYNPQSASTWVWAVPISLAATFGISVIYFPPGTEMVHFPGLAHTDLCIQSAVTGVHPAGFPHSEILGSKPACGSPRLIAACHVLHRLLAPRHPPYALSSLIIKLTQSVFFEQSPNATHFAEYVLTVCASIDRLLWRSWNWVGPRVTGHRLSISHFHQAIV
jgi:hypothetical protein